MLPGSNPFKTHVIDAPPGMPECHSLEVCVAEDADGHRVFISAWEPSDTELAKLRSGARVWLHIWANGLPPAAITVGERPDEA